MVPPTMTRDTFGLAEGVGVVAAVEDPDRDVVLSPCAFRSCRTFSLTVATIRSIRAFLSAAAGPSRRGTRQRRQRRTPAPPQTAVLTPLAVEVEEDRLPVPSRVSAPGR